MSEETQNSVVDAVVGNAGVSTFQNGLVQVVNQTYSYANSSLFIAAIAGYYQDYAYRYIKPSVEWLDGYVQSLHTAGTGIMSTHIAGALIAGLTRQIVGEKLLYRISSKKDRAAIDTLNFVSKWAKAQNIKKAVKAGVGYSLGVGTALLKMNKRLNGDIWWEACRFDTCVYLASFTGEIKEAEFLLRSYVDTRGKKGTTHYYLCEKRYYRESKGLIGPAPDYKVIEKKGELIPTVEYVVHRAGSQSLQNLTNRSMMRKTIGWTEIPEEVRKLIKNDYSVLRIGEPQKLGFINLGVVALLNGDGDIACPTGTNFGESMIIKIQDDLITYELASSYLLRDMYNGKGTVYLPKNLSLGDYGGYPNIEFSADTHEVPGNQNVASTPVAPPYMPPNPLQGMPDRVETIKGVNPEDQKAIVEQFETRAAEWQLIKENCLKNIATKWGMSPKILNSFLAVGQVQQTATQIDSEDDISIAFINLTRSYFIDALDKLLETTLNYYGKPADVHIEFSSPSLINKDRIIQRASNLRAEGIIDTEDYIRMVYPDYDEEEVQNQVKKAQEQEMKMMMQQMAAPTDEELGGGNGDLDGTTEI